MSSAIRFNLDQSKIFVFSNGLNKTSEIFVSKQRCANCIWHDFLVQVAVFIFFCDSSRYIVEPACYEQDIIVTTSFLCTVLYACGCMHLLIHLCFLICQDRNFRFMVGFQSNLAQMFFVISRSTI